MVVIGTEATIASHAYSKALEARGVHAKEKACPLLVPLVEEGWAEHPVTEQVARGFIWTKPSPTAPSLPMLWFWAAHTIHC